MSVFCFVCGKRRLITFIVCVLLILVLLNYFLNTHSESNPSAFTNSERVFYLEELGYKCVDYTPTVKEIYIPETFNDVMQKYNETQKLSGFCLDGYKGKTVIQYTYNVSDGDNVRYAHILVYNDKIIGGDISDTYLGGSMVPLCR